jgi:hypothetical protein
VWMLLLPALPPCLVSLLLRLRFLLLPMCSDD